MSRKNFRGAGPLRTRAALAFVLSSWSAAAQTTPIPPQPAVPAAQPNAPTPVQSPAPDARAPALDATPPAAVTPPAAGAAGIPEPAATQTVDPAAAPATAPTSPEGATPADLPVAEGTASESLAPGHASGGEDEAAALAALQAEISAAQAPSAGPLGSKLSLYGFADFSYTHPLRESMIGSNWGAFAVGNVNLYMGAEFAEGWRSLIEVRYTYLPHGSVPHEKLDSPRTDMTYPDYVDFGRPMRVGGIEMERAWVEYDAHRLVTIRGGQFLTPYGIWNVDHGSPVYLGVVRPYAVGQELLPERQTGLEAYGSVFVDATEIGYHLTLSNGRGPIDAYKDLDDNKALGGRLFVRNDSLLGTFQLGTSFYTGRYTDRGPDQVSVAPDGSFKVRQPVTTQYDELSWAADLKWEWQNLLVQGEFMVQQKAFTDSGRPPLLFAVRPGLTPDHHNLGSYFSVGYRTPFVNATPFAMVEYLYQGALPELRNVVGLVGGINVSPIPNIVLKGQYTRARFPGDEGGLGDNAKIDVLAFQTAWSF